MRNLISGFIYFVVGSSVLLVILIIIVTFSSNVGDFIPSSGNTSDEPVHDINANAVVEDVPGNTDRASSDFNQNVRLSEAVYYGGDFELPLNGATGYASVKLDLYTESRNSVITSLEPGKAFLILEEDGQWWKITARVSISGGMGNIRGWVMHEHCMVNLPDVIPSVIYIGSDVNAEERSYNYSGRKDGKAWNERLQRYEYIVPVLYGEAKKIYQVQSGALENGDTLIITDYTKEASAGRVTNRDYMIAGVYKYPRLRYTEHEDYGEHEVKISGGDYHITECLSIAPVSH